jgi:hypothetical protein
MYTERNLAYLILAMIAAINIFTFQNFNYSEGFRKPSTDVSGMLKVSDQEIQQTKFNLNQNLQSQGGFDHENLRDLATESIVTEPKGPIKIKLKRTPAKVQKKSKSKKSKKKKKIKKNRRN